MIQIVQFFLLSPNPYKDLLFHVFCACGVGGEGGGGNKEIFLQNVNQIMLQDGHYVGQQQDDQGYQSSLSSPNESQMKRSGSVFLRISFLPACVHNSLAPTQWVRPPVALSDFFSRSCHLMTFLPKQSVLLNEVVKVVFNQVVMEVVDEKKAEVADVSFVWIGMFWT